ncbi:PH domain-containing protein [Sphingomonas baiyangensis]|uniref:PH domain-containing protein n=1 Tax=Sphingomonas baiyangensis TaxID=2572576 RepID=A0A4U1L607_9SPHN|nr:PH domain-containing protein [Sphingomonas baiyangensis]TKD51646.1 PH domain-containing protein [Sphingomonas baiyangensis]
MHPPVTLTSLEPGQRRVMQLAALLPALALLAVSAGIGAALFAKDVPLPWLPAALAVPAVLFLVLVMPVRAYRAWGWALAEDELHVAHGLWSRVHTVVPLSRVQHLDVAQGPVERANGVARLIVHTAGTAHATVTLPGISRDTAEQLRDVIRAQIRSEPW